VGADLDIPRGIRGSETSKRNQDSCSKRNRNPGLFQDVVRIWLAYV
jgi:hypothetical protein